MDALSENNALSDTWIFNGVSREWMQVNSTGPGHRWGAAAATYEDSVLLFGGFCKFSEATSSWLPCNDLWQFNTTTLVWGSLSQKTTGASPPPRGLTSAVVMGDAMYVVSGCASSTSLDHIVSRCGDPLNDTYVLHLLTLEWSPLTSASDNAPIGTTWLATTDDATFIAYFQVQSVTYVSSFHLKGQSWSDVPVINGANEQPSGRFGASLTSIVNTTSYLLFGGLNSYKHMKLFRSSQVHSYCTGSVFLTFYTDNWILHFNSTISSNFWIDRPGTASPSVRYLANSAVYNDVVVVFGLSAKLYFI